MLAMLVLMYNVQLIHDNEIKVGVCFFAHQALS